MESSRLPNVTRSGVLIGPYAIECSVSQWQRDAADLEDLIEEKQLMTHVINAIGVATNRDRDAVLSFLSGKRSDISWLSPDYDFGALVRKRMMTAAEREEAAQARRVREVEYALQLRAYAKQRRDELQAEDERRRGERYVVLTPDLFDGFMNTLQARTGTGGLRLAGDLRVSLQESVGDWAFERVKGHTFQVRRGTMNASKVERCLVYDGTGELLGYYEPGTGRTG